METKKVYAAINAVQADLAKEGIGKIQRNVQQNYQFRGIDDLYNALAPLLSKHNLVILPRLTSHHSEEHSGKSFRVIAEYEFDFVSSEDGSSHTIKMAGEAIDYSDKATNKTASAAYKYACIQVFCIPTGSTEDSDSDSPPASPSVESLKSKLANAEDMISKNSKKIEWLQRNYDAFVKSESDFVAVRTDYAIVKEKFEKAIKALKPEKTDE